MTEPMHFDSPEGYGDYWRKRAIEAEARADIEGELALCRRAEEALMKVAEAWKRQAEARATVPDGDYERGYAEGLSAGRLSPDHDLAAGTAQARATVPDEDVLQRAMLRVLHPAVSQYADDIVREYRAILAEGAKP